MSEPVGCSIRKGTREGYACFEYVYPWPRQTKLPDSSYSWNSVGGGGGGHV